MNEYNDINLPADFDDLSKHAPLLDRLRAKGDGFVVPENYFEEAAQWSVAGCQLSVVGDKTAGFSIPENYFEELAERIISIVNLSIADNQQQTDNFFSVPENYFEKLADEITAVAGLSSLKNKESFELPEGYFNELDETLNTKIALDNLKQDEGFVLPENYFENLSGKISSRLAVDELNVGNENEIPPGYFDTLADRITARIAEEKNTAPEKIKERGRIIVFAKVLKRYSRPFSIAASLTLIISVSIWFFNNTKSNQADHLAKYIPSRHFTPLISPVQKNDFVFTPSSNEVAVAKTNKHNSPQKINHSQDADVKEQIADAMNQLDENSIADYLQSNPEINTIQQEKPGTEAISNYIIDSNIDANDLINGINNQTP